MIFKKHSELEGKHAFLGASKPSWLNYDEETLAERYESAMTAALGTRLHALAKELIILGVKLPNTHQTLNMYVNDCIGYRMMPEQTLVYSMNAFGTADAIDFRDNLLRVFDLKNGATVAKETQLEIYAALFCLEYNVKPAKIDYDLRIYQNDEIYAFDTEPERILYIMDRIMHFDKIIDAMKEV